ncbi:SRPBCC family protein [Aeromicrobium sp. NPDC092404]|uniref:SRPBCC family protein n=1 Tax=Aeromicrobium sp. NPDC092404 TaxID=3154976 RepID=UPI003413593C
MKSINRQFTVDKPARLVWDYLSDFRSTNDWDPGTKQTTRESGDGGVGTVYKNVSEFAGNEVEITYTVTDVTPGSSITLAGESKSFTSTDTITVEGSETQTQVTYVAEFDFHGLAKLAEPFAGPPLKKLGSDAEEQMLRELKKI